MDSQAIFHSPSPITGRRFQPRVQTEASTSARPASSSLRKGQVRQAKFTASRPAASKSEACVVCMNTFESRRMIPTNCGSPRHWLCEVCTKIGSGLPTKRKRTSHSPAVRRRLSLMSSSTYLIRRRRQPIFCERRKSLLERIESIARIKHARLMFQKECRRKYCNMQELQDENVCDM